MEEVDIKQFALLVDEHLRIQGWTEQYYLRDMALKILNEPPIDNVGIGGETVTNHPYSRDSQQMESAAKKEVEEYWGENDSRAYDDDYINLWKQGAKWQKKQDNK